MGSIRLGKKDGRMGIVASEWYNGLGKRAREKGVPVAATGTPGSSCERDRCLVGELLASIWKDACSVPVFLVVIYYTVECPFK